MLSSLISQVKRPKIKLVQVLELEVRLTGIRCFVLLHKIWQAVLRTVFDNDIFKQPADVYSNHSFHWSVVRNVFLPINAPMKSLGESEFADKMLF